ncbi:hypothetical protein ACIQB5_46440 [Streptomyces sp. NPDC088560]|uniref:hypothetical protein n=1 Tax=Streptomyces sp. NPDC088560 TaxID=3365868 RepID=UPI0037F47F36
MPARVAPGPSSTGSDVPAAEAVPDTGPADAGTAADTDADADAGPLDAKAAVDVVQNVRYNYGPVIGVQNVSEIQRLRGTPLPPEWIARRLYPYLADDETTKAIAARLATHRVAVIHAGAGTGRYTTALHTLTEEDVKRIRQVRREPGEHVDLEGLKDEDTGWILDLRAEEETLRTGFGHHLLEVEDHLRVMRSLVVVVTHTDAWASVADEAPALSHPLTPPKAIAVLEAHLNRRKPPIAELDKWLTAGEITQPLQKATPAQAERWAGLITSAVYLNNASAEPKSFQQLLEAVVQSAHNWRSILRDWHTRNTASAHRNYLLAAAALDGAPAETIYDAHTKLGDTLNDTPQPTSGQQGPGIIELTHTINAELGDDDRIRFLNPGYAEAVVDYFWVDRPHHVAAFTRWTAEQAALLPADLGGPLAERVTQWATRYTLAKQSFTVLRAIATDWAKTPNLRAHAQDLLVAAAVDPADGKPARDLYLVWAKAPDTEDPTERKHTPTVLKQALAAALAQLAPAYPKIALKRLSELAAHTNDNTVADAVGDALTSLWEQPTLQDTARSILSSWFSSSQRHYITAARRAFLHLAERTTLDGIPLLVSPDEDKPDAWTLAGWRCVLDDEATTPAQNAFDTWLDAALAHPRLQAAITKTFTEAVFRSDTDHTYLATRYLHLSHAAFGWQPALAEAQPSERTLLRNALVLALMEADPAAPVPPHCAQATQ